MKTRSTVAWAALGAALLVPLTVAAQQQPTQKPPAQPSLYERIGGLGGITVVVDDFIDRLVVDHLLNSNPSIKAARDRVPAPYLKYHVSAMVCQATGGPCTYTGRDMKSSHAHLRITEPEWQQMAAIFKDVLDAHGVPAQEEKELFSIVGSTKADIVMPASAAAVH